MHVDRDLRSPPEYLIALSMRLARAWPMASGVHRHVGQVGPHRDLDLEALLLERVREGLERLARSVAPPRWARGRTGGGRSSMREKSSTLSIRRESRSLSWVMIAVVLRRRALVGHPAHLERLAEHADDRQRRLQIMATRWPRSRP